MDPRYFEIAFHNAFYNRSVNNIEFSFDSVSVPYDYCGQNYPYVDQEAYERIALEKYVWPTSKDCYISSDFYGDSHVAFEFEVRIWANSSENNNHWKPEDEIIQKMKDLYIQAAIISTYFDYDDYDTPVKTYLDDLDYSSLLVNYSNSIEVRVQTNTAYLYDNLFYNLSPEKITYYNAGK